MAVGPIKTDLSTMRKQAVLCNTVFYSKASLLYACYMLVETVKKGVFRGGEILRVESLPKWQSVGEFNRRFSAILACFCSVSF